MRPPKPVVNFYRNRGKRAFDFAFALVLLLATAPVLLVTAAVVRLALGSPVLFRQQRPGLHGRPFTLLKFRTMRGAQDSRGKLLPDSQRLTRTGEMIRSLSLDELPALWNVLRGEMSLVGPRPLLMEYLPRYSPEQARRHLVLPGMTGWAQVNGRNAIGWTEKLAFDVWYADHVGFGLDLRILGLTAWKVIRREGISAPGEATAPEFKGSEPS